MAQRAAVYRKIAGETRSDARMASEGPRATVSRMRDASRPGGLSYREEIEI